MNQLHRSDIELILCCAKPRLNDERAERIRKLLSEDIDWEFVISTGRSHGVLPLIYHNLMKTSCDHVPEDILDRMKEIYIFNADRSIRLTYELLRILDKFDFHGITAIPYKGPSLAQQACGDLTLRQFVDLDIIVRKKDFIKAKELLLSDRYEPYFKMTPSQEKACLKTQYDYKFINKNTNYSVELHWALAKRYYRLKFDYEGIWARIQSLNLEGRTVSCLSPEDLLIALCIHGALHMWTSLRSICDIAAFIESNTEIDWKLLIKYANDQNNEKLLLLGLLLARDLLDAEIPKIVSDKADSSISIKSMESHIFQRLFLGKPEFFSITEYISFWFPLLENYPDKLMFLIYGLDPGPKDWSKSRLPSSLHPISHLARSIRLIKTYGAYRKSR
ncbi:MAG: nucleotidyltransferase family protein [Methanotrichaceae archaeon]|nr:nucleotidyltransferase family protein [Methanotrichaceae archaeon]